MTPAHIPCTCGTDVPVTGGETRCPECGTTYPTEGLGGASGRTEGRSEKQVQLRIKDALDGMGFHVSDLSQPRASMQTPGLPDLYVMHPNWGVALWVEVKGPTTPLSGAQKAWHSLAELAGANLVVARSVADVVAYLEELGAPVAA